MGLVLSSRVHREEYCVPGIAIHELLRNRREPVCAVTIARPTACSGKGWKDETVLLYDVQAQPSMWLIDQEGILRYFDVRGEDLGKAVRDLLAG